VNRETKTLGKSVFALDSLQFCNVLFTYRHIGHVLSLGAFAEYLLPKRLRNFMSAESGLNDGTALPFVLFPLVLSSSSSSAQMAANFLVSIDITAA